MNIVYPLLLAKDKGCGLCNQLYALTGCIDYAIRTKSFHIILLDNFLKEIGTEEYCPVSDILDLPKINDFLQAYHICLVDKHTLPLHPSRLISIMYGENDVTEQIQKHFYYRDQLSIPKQTHLLQGDDLLVIHTTLCGQYMEFKYPVNHGVLQNDIHLDFRCQELVFLPSPQLYFGGSQNPPLFGRIIQSIAFQSTFYKNTIPIIQHSPSKKINLIHLRLEDDAIQSFARENAKDPIVFKQYAEDKYIEVIRQYIDPNEFTVVISGDYENRVIRFLQENNYSFTMTSKPYAFREMNAIHDLLYATQCNHVFVGVYESSYSYTAMFHMFHPTHLNSRAVILYMNDQERPASVFDKKTQICVIQN